MRGSVCACALSLWGHAVQRVCEQAELHLMRRCVLRDGERFFRGELGGWRCAVPPVVMWGSSCSVAAASAARPGPACYSAL